MDEVETYHYLHWSLKLRLATLPRVLKYWSGKKFTQVLNSTNGKQSSLIQIGTYIDGHCLFLQSSALLAQAQNTAAAQSPAVDTAITPHTIPAVPVQPAPAAPLQTAPAILPTPVIQAETPGALAAPPVSFVDINSGRFGKLEIDLQDGQFLAGAADNLHLIARNMDLNQGELKSLDIDVKGAHIQDFIVDKMTFSTQGALNFDTGLLFNQKMLQFNSPAQAQVTAIISQESLNKFLKAPTTLERLSITATKKGGLLANLLGSAGGGGGFGLTISNASIVLGKANRVNIAAAGQIGVAQLAVPLSAELESQLCLKDGWVQVGDTKLTTAGQEISPQLSDILVKR